MSRYREGNIIDDDYSLIWIDFTTTIQFGY